MQMAKSPPHDGGSQKKLSGVLPLSKGRFAPSRHDARSFRLNFSSSARRAKAILEPNRAGISATYR